MKKFLIEAEVGDDIKPEDIEHSCVLDYAGQRDFSVKFVVELNIDLTDFKYNVKNQLEAINHCYYDLTKRIKKLEEEKNISPP